MKFAVTVVSPPGYLHSAVFAEIAEALHTSLLALGHDSVLTTEGQLPGRQHIVLGSNLLTSYALPLAPDAILYNLEQVQRGSDWISPQMIDLFRRYTVWDYSEQNAAALATLGISVARVLPIGYARALTRIAPAPVADIDVLFFGSMCERRQQVIRRMGELGLKVETVFGVYGAARDAMIARAKLVLNVHYYEAKVLEMVRISYLLANRCAVVSEHSSDPAEDASLAEGIAFGSHHELPQIARTLIDAPEQRARLAQRGFELICARPLSDYLRSALAT